MWSDHAFSADSRPPLPLALEVVYAVDADATFDAVKEPAEDRRRAVVRTVAGEGVVELAEAGGAPGTALAARAGTVLFLEFHRVRRYRPRAGAWRFWFFEYECGEELPCPAGRPLAAADPARDEAEAKECLEWLRRPSPSASACASALFAAMVHRWLAAFAAGAEARHPREAQVREAVAEMRRNLDAPLSIPALAARHGMSERAFRGAFEAVTDWSPKRYYDRLRLEKGAELLRLNRCSVGEVADRLGYSSPFHFSRAFRELFGVPPSTYGAVIRSGR